MSFMIETSARHIHLTQETLEKLFGEGRKLIFDDVVVRVNKDAVTTMHIDTDESQAAGNPKVGEIVR